MKQSFPIAALAMGAMLAAGCATKKYVGQQIDPVNQRVNQVSQQTNQQGQKLDQTASHLEKDETQLSATNERAVSAENKAGDAMNRAGEASQKADQVGRDLGDLRNTVANLDDYKQVGQTTVNFKFNSDRLEADAKAQLDQMANGENQYKRFFIAVEGFTDSVGTIEYNNELSRRRADAVVQYLVAGHNIPVYRIHMIGMGKDKPLDDAKTRAARAKNRRVEVTLYSADQAPVAMNQ
jgi:outer membrane protein OmpA-like peptidoglycan-associated protein